MFKSIIVILNLLIFEVILYMVIMTNQKKVVDMPGGIPKIDELANSLLEEESPSSGKGGENFISNSLKIGNIVDPVNLTSNHLMGKNRSNLKLK